MSDARVARLTLRAPDEALVRRGAILVEDAMRIATLEAAGERRLLIVKHFDLGEIAADAAPHTIALQIEQRLAGVRLSAVPATSPTAVAAAAVWFADEPTAIAELVRRIVGGPQPSEWFWKHVAANAVALPANAAIAQCVRAALALPQGVLALARVVEAIEDAREGAFLGELSESDGAGLLAMMFGGPIEPARGAAMSVSLGGLGTAWVARLARWTARWGRGARARWLATLAVIASRGTVGTPAIEVARAELVLGVIGMTSLAPPDATIEAAAESSRAPTAPGAIEGTAESPLAQVAEAAGVPPVTPAMTDAEAAVTAVAAARATARTIAARGQAEASRAQLMAPREPDVRRPDKAAEARTVVVPTLEVAGDSFVAGALFLVRPLLLLGMPAWLEAHPWAEDSAFALRLLGRIAARYLVNPAAEDPLVAALAGDAISDGDFTAPAEWRALTGARRELRSTVDGRRITLNGSWPLRAERGGIGELAARPYAALAWERALHRWLRAYAGVSLAWLVRRSALVVATPTHLELELKLRDADVRVRAAGLDIDPGWVPWLGRVVRFRYTGGRR
ncbi:MAG TPA: hypothetical protein VGM88_15135 [Kofleriaceae bacterium]|jgi:hypothetical protein